MTFASEIRIHLLEQRDEHIEKQDVRNSDEDDGQNERHRRIRISAG